VQGAWPRRHATDVLRRSHEACTTQHARRSGEKRLPRTRHAAQHSVVISTKRPKAARRRATPPARLPPPHAARAGARCLVVLRGASGVASARRLSRPTLGFGISPPPQRAAGPGGTRAFTKPMSLAYSRKHWRHMSSAYLRIRPFWLEHTRLRDRAQRSVSASPQRSATHATHARRLGQAPRGGAACAARRRAAERVRSPAHQLRPPLAWSLLWLFHTAAKPMTASGRGQASESQRVRSAAKRARFRRDPSGPAGLARARQVHVSGTRRRMHGGNVVYHRDEVQHQNQRPGCNIAQCTHCAWARARPPHALASLQGAAASGIASSVGTGAGGASPATMRSRAAMRLRSSTCSSVAAPPAACSAARCMNTR